MKILLCYLCFLRAINIAALVVDDNTTFQRKQDVYHVLFTGSFLHFLIYALDVQCQANKGQKILKRRGTLAGIQLDFDQNDAGTL